MRQILFSCIGTSDPLRGEHDGPMLHILRHYRPESVWLFLTPEIQSLAAEDERLERTREWLTAHWSGYAPVFHYINGDVQNAHDLDALDAPLHEAVRQLSREEPDAEILINVTSGTPQMQMILSQMVMDMRYRARGIQVSNFEKSSGRSQRTNDRDYDIELELECNEDESPDAENRCVEPEMYAIHREYARRQITTLLDRRDFSAVEALKDELPETLGKLALHLAARSRLDSGAAQNLARELQPSLPFKLYAYKSGSRRAYNEVIEYYLMVKNLVRAGNCTEFVLHLEPLVLTLQLAVLDLMLKGSGCSTADFVVQERQRQVFYPELLRAKHQALYAHLMSCFPECCAGDISTRLCADLLGYFDNKLPEKARALFAHYGKLKDLRNRLAHSLRTVTAGEIKTACGVRPEVLLDELEKTIIAAYEACDPVIFSVYDKSIDYIKAQL